MKKNQTVYVIVAIICLCIIGVAVSVTRGSSGDGHAKSGNRLPKETSQIETKSDEPVDAISIKENKDSSKIEEPVENQTNDKDGSENEIEDLTGIENSKAEDDSKNAAENKLVSEMEDLENDVERNPVSVIDDSDNNQEVMTDDEGIELPIIEF